MEQARLKLLLREAIKSLQSGNKEWARECLTRILKANPRHEEAWLWLSAVLETPAEKRYCLEKVLVINPNNEQARTGLQQLSALESGYRPPKRTICPMCGEPNPPAAFQCANCGQDLFVQCPSCGERVDIDRTSCAHCGLELGDSADGAAYFFRLGELYLQHGKPKQALAVWDKTLILEPDFPGIAEVAAEAFLATGQRELALQSLRRALEEATEPAQRRKIRLRMARAYRDWGQLDEAVRLCREILHEDQEARSPQADVYAELGRLYEAAGDEEEARQHYEMALLLDEQLHEVRLALADLLLAQGYEYRALSEYRALQTVEGPVGQQAAERIRSLRPPVPEEFRNRWQETLRGV
ncbi:MAG: tetratricopeptide repeat protein, partial [Chloroflexia bacterium]